MTLARAFVLCALIFGGAGISSPFANAVIVLLGLVVLVRRLPSMEWSRLDMTARIAAWLVLASVALCLIQVVPLPRGIWSGLPGHSLAAQIASAVGGGGWTAWSLAPDRTLDALAALMPPVAAIVIAAQASPAERRSILRMLLVVALVSAAIAVVQIGAGPSSAPLLFETRHRGLGVGFFVNRNHLALFLLMAMLIAALPGIPLFSRKLENPKAVEWGLRCGSLVLLGLGLLSTLSRTGIFLAPLALAAAILLSQRSRVKIPILLGGISAAGVLALILRSAPPVQMLLARFASAAEDKRFQYWANTRDAIWDSLPLGTGLNTFTLVYPTFEPLAEVHPDVVNHAHSDLLELALETGFAGVALLLGWLAFVAFAGFRAHRTATSRRERLLPLAVGVCVILTVAASVVDYPIRMFAISVTLALLVGMLLPPMSAAVTAASPDAESRPRPSLFGKLIMAPLALIAVLTISSQGGQQLVFWGNAPAAAVLAPWSSLVQSAAASRYEILGESARSSQAARRALALTSLDAGALRAEGMAALALGRSEHGTQLMSLGARLGWRDGITQLWLIEQAMAADVPGFAVQRIDAVVRQEKLGDELLPYLPGLMRREDGRAALAEQLAFLPGWRQAFFNFAARDRTWTIPQFLDLAARLRRTSAPITATDTALIRAVLADLGRMDDARQVWRASGQTALIGDGRFEESPSELPLGAAPYAWAAPPLAGVRLQPAEPEIGRTGRAGGKAMSVSSDGVVPGLALAQGVVLDPGRYTLAFSSAAKDEALPRTLRATFGCRFDVTGPRGTQIAVPLAWRMGKEGWQHARGSFQIPPDCPGQVFMLWIPQSDGRPYSFWIDDVSIRSIGQAGA